MERKELIKQFIIKEIYHYCDNEMIDWWEVVDSCRFDEIIMEADSSFVFTQEEHLFIADWYAKLENVIEAIKDIENV